MSSGRQPKPPEQSSHPTVQREKHSGKRERGSEEASESQIGSNNHKGGKQSKVSRAKSSRFPCPFALRDPAKYGGENGCSNYSRPIETVIRHHVLGKHRKEYQEAGNGEDDIFNKVEKLAGKSGSSKQKAPEELWKSMYKVLFEVDSSEEDNIPEPSIQTNARAMDVDSIHAHVVKCVATNPFYPIEVVDLIEEVDTLKRQRTEAKDNIRRAAEKDISAIRDRVAVELQQVNAHYDEKLFNARSRLEERLTSGSQMPIEEGRSVPSVASFDIQSSISGLARGPPQATAPQGDVSTSPYVTVQAALYEPPAWSYASQHHHTASASETALLLPSDEGYYSLNRVGYCEHRLSEDDSWCDDCLALFGND